MFSDLPQHLLGLPVLTILPPWGTAVARWGKPDENRGRPPPKALHGQRLGVHQGQLHTYPNGRLRNDARSREVNYAIGGLLEDGLIPGRDDPRSEAIARFRAQVVADAGRLLCIVTVADALDVHHDINKWMIPGQVAWQFTELEPLAEPILLSGLQGVWRLTHQRRTVALMMDAAKRERTRTA
jgi:hypothetical protein